MGFYIETGTARNKTKWIVDNLGGVVTDGPQPGTEDVIPVCVIDNGPFEAAGIAFGLVLTMWHKSTKD